MYGNACHYPVKFIRQEHLMKKMIDYFVTTKMSTNVVCMSESFTAFILRNEKSSIRNLDFTLLTFDHYDRVSLYLFDTDLTKYYHQNMGYNPHFDLKNMHNCTTIFYSNDDTYQPTKEYIDSLIDKVIKILLNMFNERDWYTERHSLFY